jgi:transposase
MVADLARQETARDRELTIEINQLEHDIQQRVTVLVPSLVAIPGCGALTGGKLIGDPADITRFRPRDAYAMWAGVAPIPVWSANNTRFRPNRGGNRQTNAALHRIAITQIRMHPDPQAFIKRRIETGSTKQEAIKPLKQRLANIVYRTHLQDTQTTPLQQAA